MSTEHDIIEALQRLRGETDGVVAAAHAGRIRTAMHAEVARRRRGWRFVAWLPVTLSPRLALVGAGVAGAAAAVLSVGWGSPPGSPLHDVQVARQWVQRSLPGSDQSALLLSWAESDLRDAASGANRAAALNEATTLLDECRSYVAASPATLQRWQHDESTLDSLEQSAPAGSTTTSPAPPGGDDTASGQGGGDHGGTPGGSGSSGSGITSSPSAEPSESATPTSSGSHDGGSSGGSATPSPAATATPAPSPTSGSDGGSGTSGSGSS